MELRSEYLAFEELKNCRLVRINIEELRQLLTHERQRQSASLPVPLSARSTKATTSRPAASIAADNAHRQA